MSNRVLAASKCCTRHYIVRIVKPKTSSYSHDWHVLPDCQRSVAGDRLSGPLGSRNPQLSCVSSNLLRCFKRIYRKYRYFGSLSTDYFPSRSALEAAQNLKDRRKPHMAFWWAFCPGGDFSLALQWIARLEGLTFATDFPERSSARRLRPNFKACACSGSRYGLNSPVEQLPLRSSTAGWVCLCPTAKLYRDHCLLQLFKTTTFR